MKRIVTICFLTGITLPFVLLTDLYPFFRFGMFAEPVKREVQTEQFVLQYIDRKGLTHVVEAGEIGLGGLDYLLRNYYYRSETSQLLQHIHQLYPQNRHVQEWKLLRVTSPVDQFRPDTIVAGQWATR